MKIFVEFGHPTHAKVCSHHQGSELKLALSNFRKAVTVSMEDFLREELFRLRYMIKCFMRKKIFHTDLVPDDGLLGHVASENHVPPE